jgi:hypothetical protein
MKMIKNLLADVNGWRKLKPCRKCGRVQYRSPNSLYGNDIVYISKEALVDLHDINCTFEKFEMYIPDIIVSKRVYEYFNKNYPRLLFDPLFLK